MGKSIIPAGMNFWNPWPTWEKLTFVLGCGIFFVFIIGFVVKFRNARRIRKLEARTAKDLAERGESTVRQSEEVPFGVRAIEAGCEVDGIWNSKAATPLQVATPPQAPSQKSISEPSTPTMKPLELPEAVHIRPIVAGKRRIVIGGPSLPRDATNNIIERMDAHRKQLSAESGQLRRGGRTTEKENTFYSCEERC